MQRVAGEPTESRLTDPRVRRFAFVPAALALITVMFSLDGVPEAIEPVTPSGTFDGRVAARDAREIARLAPSREPGSDGDDAAAEFVREQFNTIPAGAIGETTFEAEVDGETHELRNVALTLPGEASGTTVVIADRSSTGPGAASSAAATGVLTELATALGVGHQRSYLLVSTTAGARGIEAAIDAVPDPAGVNAVIVVRQPGPADPAPPYATTGSIDTTSGPLQLRRTAEGAIEAQGSFGSPGQSAFTQLSRLAFPSGLGGEATLVGDGLPAIGIGSHGERPLSGEDDGEASTASIDAFGRSIFALIDAVDVGPALEHGPSTYVELGDNLIPGWTLAVLALTLLLPGLVTAVDAGARVARRGGDLGRPLLWAAARSLPFVGAAAALYGLSLTGLIPHPDFPFDPAGFGTGARTVIAFSLIAIVLVVSAISLRRTGVTGARAPVGSLAAVGLLTALAGVALWAANPYLALLAAPAVNVWLLADAPRSRNRTALVLGATLLSLLPIGAALGAVSASLSLGGEAPWTFTMMIADGQIGLVTVLAGSVIAGGLAGAAALTLGGGGRLPALPGGAAR